MKKSAGWTMAVLLPVGLSACGSSPTYWSEEATHAIDDLAFIEVPDGQGGRMRLFGLGFDTHGNGPWDGVSGENECYRDAQGAAHGFLDIVQQMNEQAFADGANFAYVWSGRERLGAAGGKIFGIWHDGFGTEPSPSADVVPVVYNGAGESDMASDKEARIAELSADFAAFRERRDAYSPERRPSLPGYDEMPWYAWHPTWRIRGQGDGKGEECTPAQADGFASATTMMIGDNYTYVTNRWPSYLNPITGQKGEEGEGYDLWLERDDPDHRSYFSAAWNMIHSAVSRARRLPADPQHPTVVWAWMQGHAFDDDIGRNTCFNGSSDLWARGSFPTLAYLRKEIMSTVVAGGTGIVFFGYHYCRFTEAEKVRLFFRALSHPEVYQPALLSPRLDLGADLAFVGEPGYDGQGRVHLLAKWHAASRRAFLLGANPGARETPFEVEFPWSLKKVEILDWGAPAADENAAPQPPRFVPATEVRIRDRRLSMTAPRDDGFVLRITPFER